MPQSYPNYPEFICTKLESARGHQPTGQTSDPAGLALPHVDYGRIKCDFLFEHSAFALQTDSYVNTNGFDETLRYYQVLPSRMDTDWISYQGGIMRYLTSAGGATRPNLQQIQANIGFPEINADVRRMWWRVPFNAWTAYDPDTGTASPLWARVYGNLGSGTKPMSGTVNNASLFGYPAGSLLFMGVDEELKLDPLGQGQCWNLLFKWMFKPRAFTTFFSTKTRRRARSGLRTSRVTTSRGAGPRTTRRGASPPAWPCLLKRITTSSPHFTEAPAPRSSRPCIRTAWHRCGWRR